MTATNKPQLPKGKITIRLRQMRGFFQAFAGNTYIVGASGETAVEAAQELANQYEVEAGNLVTVYGYDQPVQIQMPESDKY